MKYYSVVTFSLFLISPLFSLPLILYGVYHRYKSSILFFALFVGLMGYLTPPVSDLYRHTIDYYSYEFLSWKAFRGTLERDFVTQTLSYVFCKNSIPYDFIRFLYLTIQFYVSLWVFYKVSNANVYKRGKRDLFLRFLIWILFSNFIVSALGVRFPLASSFYVLGCYYLLHKRNMKKAIFFFGISMCVHFSMCYFIILLFVIYKIPFKKRSAVLCMIMVSLIISEVVIKNLESYFISQDLYGGAYWGNGIWGTGFKEQASLKGVIYSYIMQACMIPYYIYFYKSYDSQNRWCRWMSGALILIVMSFSLETVSSRVRPLFGALSMAYLLAMESKGKIMSDKLRRAFVFFACIAFMSNLYTNRETIIHSRYLRIAEPVPLLLSDHYTKYWVFTNVANDGSIK